MELIARLSEAPSTRGSLLLLLLQIHELIRREWQITVCHIPRDANRVADVLAKQGISRTAFLDDCPQFLRAWINQESMGSFSQGNWF